MQSVLRVSLSAIRSNLSALRRLAPSSHRMMMMVKGEGYGTDAVQLAHHLAGAVDLLGVAHAAEAAELRDGGIDGEIFILHTPANEAEAGVSLRGHLGVDQPDQIAAIGREAEKQGRSVPCHLQVNTGFHRFGCPPSQVGTLAKQIASHPFLELAGVMTHYAAADEAAQDPFTLEQSERFDRALGDLKREGLAVPMVHAANSAAFARFPDRHYSMSRIGILAYGVHPSEDTHSCVDVTPAITLATRVVQIHSCQPGDTIGYGRGYTATREEERVGILPLGYADGIPRDYGRKGGVLIGGKRVSLFGHVCMDYMMVDLTGLPHVQVGETATLIGEDGHGNAITVEQIAAWDNTAVQEPIARLNRRLARQFM